MTTQHHHEIHLGCSVFAVDHLVTIARLALEGPGVVTVVDVLGRLSGVSFRSLDEALATLELAQGLNKPVAACLAAVEALADDLVDAPPTAAPTTTPEPPLLTSKVTFEQSPYTTGTIIAHNDYPERRMEVIEILPGTMYDANELRVQSLEPNDSGIFVKWRLTFDQARKYYHDVSLRPSNVRDVPCTFCCAPAGAPCITRNGKESRLTHRRRYYDFVTSKKTS